MKTLMETINLCPWKTVLGIKYVIANYQQQ